MELNTVNCGDALSVVSTFPDKSVNCIITSPPYYKLRDYGFKKQWGLEEHYKDYLDKMIALAKELKRVLKDDGTIWINMGDSYNGSGGNGWQGLGSKNWKQETKPHKDKTYPVKCLMLIPHRFAIRCIDEVGLILRNDIIWAKRNGMPESARDRFNKKHEYVFFFAKNKKYYFNLDAIRDVNKYDGRKDIFFKGSKKYKDSGQTFCAKGHRRWNPNGKNPGDVSDFWNIPTRSSSVKHYATFNSNLIDKPIIAGCPEGGVILDPFCGSGTTLVRAKQLKRNYIGIDGKKGYCRIAEKRLRTEV